MKLNINIDAEALSPELIRHLTAGEFDLNERETALVQRSLKTIDWKITLHLETAETREARAQLRADCENASSIPSERD